MGQCSSTSKQQKNKSESVERFDAPALEEDETIDEQGDIVEPQLSGPRQQRRAIDEHGRRDRDPFADRKDFGLTALRPSLDSDTCTALLALRMGRGSSVGGLLNTAGSLHSGDNAVSTGEGCSPKASAKQLDLGGKTAMTPRPSGLSKGAWSGSCDSNERLEKMLDDAESGSAPRVPPAQS